MTVKLVGSTSGSVSLQAPASTTGGANIEFKLPVADGSANQLLKTDGSGNLGWATDQGGKFASYALLQNQHSSTSANLGTFTAGDWRTRDINTEVADEDNIVTLSSNQFTLQAGSYLIRFTQTAYAVNRLAVRLRNITDSTTAGFGEAAYYNAGQGNVWSTSAIARVVISGAKVFEVQGRAETTKSANGFGFTMITGACTNTSVEIYKES